MGLRDFTVDTMLGLSGPWLDDNQDRPTIESYSILIGPLEAVGQGHAMLVDFQQEEGSNQKRIAELTEKLTELDRRHDRKARACFYFLKGLIDDSDDPDEARRWTRVRDALFVDGLSINQASYIEEAGYVDRVRARITPDIQQALDDVEIDGKPLAETVEEWLGAATELGQAHNERAGLKGQDDDGVTAGDVRDARFFWIRAVKAFVELVELTDMTEAERATILSPLREAERAASARDDADEEPADDEPVEPSDEEETSEEGDDAPADEADVDADAEADAEEPAVDPAE